MKKCPHCNNWTLDFDEYFGRFRCFNPDCGWMARSSAEREIRLLRSGKQPRELNKRLIKELGLTLTSAYDYANDALLFDFGLDEPTFDLPESDGRMIWKIGHRSNRVVGFAILGAKKLGVSEVHIDIAARKQNVESGLKSAPGMMIGGNATRVLIERVAVMAKLNGAEASPANLQIEDAFQQAISAFENLPDSEFSEREYAHL